MTNSWKLDLIEELHLKGRSLVEAVAEHRNLPIQSFVERVSSGLLSGEAQTDDFTLLGVEMLA